jgi:hypothetical protein
MHDMEFEIFEYPLYSIDFIFKIQKKNNLQQNTYNKHNQQMNLMNVLDQIV